MAQLGLDCLNYGYIESILLLDCGSIGSGLVWSSLVYKSNYSWDWTGNGTGTGLELDWDWG